MSLPTMQEACDELNLRVPSSRKVECPKHSDSTSSLHIYKDSFYCFSCGANGDAIGLIAHYTGEDVRRLLARRGNRSQSRRSATKGMNVNDMHRSVQRRRRNLEHWWFDCIADCYKDSKDWALIRAVDLWSEVFRDLDERIVGKGAWLGEDKLAPYEAEKLIATLRSDLEAALPLEVAEGKRTREQ